MQKKYFFFDIDGTLTDRNTGQIVPSAREALDKLRAAGHFVSIATGRASYKAIPFARKHDFENMVCNGGHGIYFEGEMRENRPMKREKSLAVYRQAVSLGYGVLVALDDSRKVYASNFNFIEQAGTRKEPTTYIIDDQFDPVEEKAIYKMYVSIPEEEEGKLTLRLLMDRESIELFINDGERAVTSLIPTPMEADGITFAADAPLRLSVEAHHLA